MITALSACVGVTIRVSWCRRHGLVGKWRRRGCGLEQSVSSFQNTLWCWSGEVDASTPTTPSWVRLRGLFVFLSIWGTSMFHSMRDFFFFFLLLPSESTSRISVRFLELCTRASIIRAYSGPGRRLGATGFKWRGRRHTCGPVCDSAMLPAWWRLFMPRVAAAAGNLSVAFVSTCVIPGPCIIYAAPQMRAFSG